MTYRERREARADRLRGWAAKRQTAAAAVFKAGEPYTSDTAFNTQPGHIPFRARLIAREDRAHESIEKAAGMDRRADGIEAQLARSIYDDDPDAIDALRERIAGLEVTRDRYKAVNAIIRKAARGVTGAANYRAMLETLAKAGSITPREFTDLTNMIAAFGGFHDRRPPTYTYTLTNLSGNIARNRERLERLERTVARGAAQA